MDWNTVERNWKELKGKLKEKWGNITDDELDAIAGEREQLVGKIQIRYEIAREEAERQVNAFVRTIKPSVNVQAFLIRGGGFHDC
ncbi:hypothetical protein Nstercoris_00370 [Nitrosomonas stercoris]|uniref:CsbD-like domain-containing protein n=1 Tax=Nitrosomonas stercoris TaxID=1444684 RepID=A0A4Y1YM93_9PROT|nr:hypothetical protein Nstercoris_00370 [Nitrosomonas stercoris]